MSEKNLKFWKDKKVFITGHTGFKGSWLSMILNHSGAMITGYSLSPPTDPSLFESAKVDKLVSSNIKDIRDSEALQAALLKAKPEIVFHLAAQPIVLESYKDPIETYTTNVIGTLNLMQAVRFTPSVKAIVIITTDKCYENREWIWPYRESDALGGYDPYSSSKACAEIVTASMRNSFFNVSRYPEHGVAVATVRAGNVVGGGDWAKDRLVPDIIRSLLKKETIILRNPGAIRPWQHVFEPLSGYMLLAEKLYTEGPKYAEAFNFGPHDEDARTVEWIVKELCKSWGSAAKYEVRGQPDLHEAYYLKLDWSKAKTLLNWSPKWDLGTALKYVVEWSKVYHDHGDIYGICLKQIEDYFK